jgi:hypothetical protein
LVEFSEIKADLPDWPDEVIQEWLLPLANRGDDTGWPPPAPLKGAWKGILGGRTLAWWKQVMWKLEEREVTFGALSNRSRQLVQGMLDAHVNNIPNDYAGMLNGKKRFLSAGQYVSEHGTFPKPLVAMQSKDGLSVIDGNHRLTALCFRQAASERVINVSGVPPSKLHKLWLGTHQNGEVPI